MSELANCPNCKTELKSGQMSSTKLLDSDKTKVINEYHDQKSEGYYNKCGKELYNKYKSALLDEKKKISSRLQKLISTIPVISTHTPLNWDYNILGFLSKKVS